LRGNDSNDINDIGMLHLLAEPMASLTVRNLDDGVKGALRRRAAAHGRSLEAEVRKILTDTVAIEPKPRTGAELLRRIRDIVEPVGGIELDIPSRNRRARRPPDFE
jgi:antitoxin FitA